jgi:hypothetical protein
MPAGRATELPKSGTEDKNCMHRAAQTEETLKLNIVAQGGSWLNFTES